jgi:hypothetical protein
MGDARPTRLCGTAIAGSRLRPAGALAEAAMRPMRERGARGLDA